MLRAAWNIFRCIGEAVVDVNVGGLLRELPFGEPLYNIAAGAWKRWRELQRQQEARQELEASVQIKFEDFEQRMRQLAVEIAPRQPPQVQQALAGYLSLIPARIKQTFSRPEDPSGTTIPGDWQLRRPEDLLPLLPPRPPRFQAGMSPPNAPQWVLVKRLGIGGFGEVWQAHNKHQPELVTAFKFCLDPQGQEQLLTHEARMALKVVQGVAHPGIVQLQDLDLNAEAPWLRYEYVPGGDLAQLAAHWAGDPAQRVRSATLAVWNLAQAVDYCHRLKPQVVHRDLKPANILAGRDPDGNVRLKIADFGIGELVAAQALDEARLLTAAVASQSVPTLLRSAHTPLYASPQQKAGFKADPRDDVHALGVIWYQLLLGQFHLGPPTGRYWKKQLAALGVVPAIFDLVEACCDAEPQGRPDDAQELFQLIGNLMVEPSPAPPTSPPRPPTPKKPDSQQVFTNSLGMKFARVPAGTFWMGGGSDEPGDRQIDIARAFYLGVYPVTQGEWQAVMGTNPSHFSRSGGGKDQVKRFSDGDLKQFPVEDVSWENAQQFIDKLNAREKSSEWMYCFPSEAEWEYACRGGATSQQDCEFDFYFDRPTNHLSSTQANFDGNNPAGNAPKGQYLKRTTKVGSYKPNRLGLYDMHGNVWEWCEDAGASQRVARGGGWYNDAGSCRAADRSTNPPSRRNGSRGLRLARVPSGG